MLLNAFPLRTMKKLTIPYQANPDFGDDYTPVWGLVASSEVVHDGVGYSWVLGWEKINNLHSLWGMTFQIKESKEQNPKMSTAEKLTKLLYICFWLYSSEFSFTSHRTSFWMCSWLVLPPLQCSERTTCYKQQKPRDLGVCPTTALLSEGRLPTYNVPSFVSCDSAL